MTILKKIFSMGTICEQLLKERDAEKIAALKMYLMERMGAPAGLHTAGIPLILSGFLSLFSFVIPQIPFWIHAFSWLNLPPQAMLVISAVAAVIFSAGSYKLINSQMFLQTSAFYLHNRVWRWQLAHPANNKVR